MAAVAAEQSLAAGAAPVETATPGRRRRVGRTVAALALTVSGVIGGSACAAPAAPPPAGNPRAGDVSSVYFSPFDDPTTYPGVVGADTNIGRKDWAAGNCQPGLAPSKVPPGTNVLSGFSLGRLGVDYFMMAATEGQRADVHTVMLIDPGSSADLEQDTCDPQLEPYKLFTSWLGQRPVNRLIIFAGDQTRQPDASGQATFQGIRDEYLRGMHATPVAAQAIVCEYPSTGHEQLFRATAPLLDHPPLDGCPEIPGLTAPQAHTA